MLRNTGLISRNIDNKRQLARLKHTGDSSGAKNRMMTNTVYGGG